MRSTGVDSPRASIESPSPHARASARPPLEGASPHSRFSPFRRTLFGSGRGVWSYSLPVRTAFLLGAVVGALVWELWQGTTGRGLGLVTTSPLQLGSLVPSLFQPGGSSSGLEAVSCDFSDDRTDVCRLIGDVRLNAPERHLILYASQPATWRGNRTMRPHPLKQEAEFYEGPKTMARDIVQERIHAAARRNALLDSVQPVLIQSVEARTGGALRCSQQYSAPLLLFSTGGYNGNTYHTMNDGIVPLFISAQHLRGEVVLGIVDFQEWWLERFGPLLAQLSRYPPLLLGRAQGLPDMIENMEGHMVPATASSAGVHCFRDVTVGLRSHKPNLCVNPARMPGGETNRDLTKMFAKAYNLPEPKPRVAGPDSSLVLGLISREKTRRILNEREVISEAKRMGFDMRVISEALLVKKDYVRVMESTLELDALMGVHGAGLTQLALMRPGTVVVQIVPVGAEWISESDFGECAKHAGFHYIQHNVTKDECSLIREYDGGHEVFTNSSKIWEKGWQYGSDLFLSQDVQLNPETIKRLLKETFEVLTGTATFGPQRPPERTANESRS